MPTEPFQIKEDDVRLAVADFKHAMALRSELNLRVARRVTFMLRAGMLSFAVVTVILMMMLFAFTSRVGDMIGVLDTMRVQFSSMASDMRHMRKVVASMDADMQSFPVITDELTAMRQRVAVMDSTLRSMTDKVGAIDGNLGQITRNVSGMTGSFRQLETSVHGIGANVNQASQPVKTFNNFFPMFNW